MIFTSMSFLLIFLPAFFIIYKITKKSNIIILIFSMLFYFWGEQWLIAVMIASIFIDYFCGKKIYFFREKGLAKNAKAYLILSLVSNLLILFVFKYFNFFSEQLLEIVSFIVGDKPDWQLVKIVLPLGISFYTFQSMSYSFDIYRGVVKPTRSFFNFATYVTLFPQLVAGPIVRYSQLNYELESRTSPGYDYMAYGIRRFMRGVIKKVLIANNSAVIADFYFSSNEPGFLGSWIGAISYMIQIYFDFSGYSDMAIGLGRMTGFHFPENFNFPYISRSIQDFWKRWHISLSSWFRDYLYIPLGGSRGGDFKTYRNLLIVFLLCGFWHGAEWTFIIWGLYHGAFLILERTSFSNILLKFKLISHLYVSFVVIIGWVIFRSESLFELKSYLEQMFIFSNYQIILPDTFQYNVFFLILGIIFSRPYTLFELNVSKENLFLDFLTIFLFIFSLSEILAGGYNPFIYFRF